MTGKIIHCRVHGRVQGFCRQCKVERYLERVRLGEIIPKELVEITERSPKEPSPLQIRFRAFMSRMTREKSGKTYSWENTNRGIRIIDTKNLGESL